MTVLPQLKRDLFNVAQATLSQELDSAARQAAGSGTGHSARHRVPRPSIGGLVATFGVTVAAAIAVLALVLPGRHHAAPTPAAQGPSSLAQLKRHPEIKQLLAHFAILRRPQTAADRAWAAGQRSDPKGGGQVIPRLTRLATTIDGKRIFLTINRDSSPAAPGDSPRHAYSMTVALVAAHNNTAEAPYDPNVGDYTIYPVPLSENPSSKLPPLSGPSVLVSIVPDGITKVRWVFRCSPARVTACGGRRTEVINPPLHENIAAAKTPGRGPVPTVTWYDASGKAVLVYNPHEPGKHQPKPFPGIQP